MPANGATATSSAVAGNVRLKAVAELTSMADMRRKAVMHASRIPHSVASRELVMAFP